MDCTAELVRKLFSGSEVGKQISYARTKTEAIINNVIFPHILDIVLDKLRSDTILYFGVFTESVDNFK